jgi:nucleotide-binding universal stress UspA family protein
MNTADRPTVERIVVALDASPSSLAALRVAAQLAAQLQAELQGLFVEDANLIRLCALPFGEEVGLVSGATRRLDSHNLERQLRAMALSLQQAMARVADPMRVRWSFHVTRGNVVDELIAAAENAQLLSLGAHQQSAGSTLGAATATVIERSQRPVLLLGREGRLTRPFTLVYTGSERAERALQLAIHLTQRTDGQLTVILPLNQTEAERAATRLATLLADQGIDARIIRSQAIVPFERQDGTLILPAEHANLLPRMVGPVIVVP